MNIAICDDNKAICSQVKNIISNYMNSTFSPLTINVFYSGEDLLDYLYLENIVDLIFLDIELENMNGIEVGQQIRHVFNDNRTEIVYMSGRDEYDRQLFDVQPLLFIGKPIKKEPIIRAIQLTVKRQRISDKLFSYQKDNEFYQIPLSEIIYFESLNRKIIIVTTKFTDSFYGNLKQITQELFKSNFFPIHRSYLINYNHTKIIRYSEVVVSNKETLPISRTKRKAFRKFQVDLF
jgi:DNA-binding LytR/AlgR family response regulator